MSKKTLFMETTAVPAAKTSAEITALLVEGGARQISLVYDDKRKPVGLTFTIPVHSVVLSFSLPVRIDPIFKYLRSRNSSVKRGYSLSQTQTDQLRAQAERVAWRQLLRWIQAQLAMIETGMVQLHEVFLPYMQQQNGQTVFEIFTEKQLPQLPPAKEPR